MKKTLMTIALTAATVPFTFGQTPANNAPANDTKTTVKKHSKKARHSKKHNKAATATPSAAPTK